MSQAFEIISEIEGRLAFMDDSLTAFDLLLNDMENEGCQPSDDFSEIKAVICGRRLPAFLSALQVVCRDLNAQKDAAAKAVEAAYALKRQEVTA